MPCDLRFVGFFVDHFVLYYKYIATMRKTKVIIMGAAGRDFHNFNIYFKNNPNYRVVAFTASQIPGISDRKYKNIPIYPEEKLPTLIKEKGVDEVFFSYSDMSYNSLMSKASAVAAAGAQFTLLSPRQTMLNSTKPVVAVTAVRTGCGKSLISQKIATYFKNHGLRVGIARHPMPYGDLKKQICQKFDCLEDLKKHDCTIEEREEYEPYIEKGFSLCAGVDYAKILKLLEKDSDVILWDGGNNDTPFFKPNLYIAITDARRPFHETQYYPGEINFRNADMIIVNKIDKKSKKNVETILANIVRYNPKAKVVKMKAPVFLDKPSLVRGKKVLVVEDGPSVTHGGLPHGAGFEAAKKYGAGEIVDPRKYSVGSLTRVFEEYKHLDNVLPAMGYGRRQMKDLESSINNTPCDAVVLATPSRIEKFLSLKKPVARADFDFKEIGGSVFGGVLKKFLF